jgi:hypothetical protein
MRTFSNLFIGFTSILDIPTEARQPGGEQIPALLDAPLICQACDTFLGVLLNPCLFCNDTVPGGG